MDSPAFFQDLALLLHIAICCPQVFNTLIRLNRSVRAGLSQPFCLTQVFPNYGLAMFLPTEPIPMLPKIRPQLGDCIYRCFNKLYLAPLKTWPALAGITDLDILFTRLESIICNNQFLEWRVPFAEDGEFLGDCFADLRFWFKQGVGVMGGRENNRVLVARSLPEFLTDMMVYGLLCPAGFSYRRDRLFKPRLMNYWLWPRWPSNKNSFEGLCSRCTSPADEGYHCGNCRNFRLCLYCCLAEQGELESFYHNGMRRRTSINVIKESPECNHELRSITVFAYYCCRCKIAVDRSTSSISQETFYKNWVWCSDCAGREEDIALIPWTTSCFECSNCSRILANDHDYWYECQVEACYKGAMHAICQTCFADTGSCSLSHNLEHEMIMSCPECVQFLCHECGCRRVSPFAYCPDTECPTNCYSSEDSESIEESDEDIMDWEALGDGVDDESNSDSAGDV